MAKKNQVNSEESQRQSRKEILRARKQEEQLRQIRVAIGAIVALVVLVIVVAVINEFFIVPNRAVATVEGQDITLGDWQDRVRFERAQRIIGLENQLEILGGDVGLVQQFSGQTLQELQQPEALGEQTLTQMVNEEIVRQGAEARGIAVTDTEVDERIGEFFNYFGGVPPTPQPTATQTVMPTPSLTPLPAAGADDATPTSTPPPTATLGPTQTPLPTPTAVSEESFQQELGDLVDQLESNSSSEEVYRRVIAAQMYTERLTDALVEEQGFTGEDEQASFYYIAFNSEAEAQAAADEIQTGDYLTYWNTIRSEPPGEEAPTATASEILWRTQASLESTFGAEIAEVAFTLPPNVPSQPIAVTGQDGSTQYLVVMVSGREIRPLPANELANRRQQILTAFVDDAFINGNVNLTDAWRGRTPTVPVLDAKFLAPPTPTPPQAEVTVPPIVPEGETTP